MNRVTKLDKIVNNHNYSFAPMHNNHINLATVTIDETKKRSDLEWKRLRVAYIYRALIDRDTRLCQMGNKRTS